MSENNEKSQKKSTGMLVPILAIITIGCVIFSALQTVYIIRLASGEVGNMSYAQSTQSREEGEGSNEETQMTVSPVADPEFSLEHAASVTDPNKTTLSTTEIVQQVSPAVVSVYVMEHVGGTTSPLFTGSGFIVSSEGYVVTNEHVVTEVSEGADYDIIVVVPGYDIPIDATLVGTDVQTDIAVLKLDEQGEEFPYVTLGDSDMLQVGELVVAIGNPLGRLQGTVTVGVVSALDRQINNNGYTLDLLQTDASINSGNSGGPLINSFGEVIGVTNAKISTGEGLGFAIPISDVADEIQSIINYGYVANRPYIGITVGNVASDAYYGAVEGVYVAEVDPGSPAEEAGMQEGDMIISMDGVAIEMTDDIIDVRNQHVPGDEIEVVVERNGRQIELNLVIGDSNDAE
ncbi:MAG: trypsin-like peptidase domain-containing protein [Clostridiales bacterium]|nr:trypsin-like peptidase domain-containing protein [Clostridiales bacterium]